MKSLTRAGTLLLAPLLIVACGRDEPNRTGYEKLTVTADTSEGYEEPSAAPVTPTQSGVYFEGPLTVTGNFRPIAEGAPPGSITVTEYGEGTRVLIKLDRYTPGTELAVSFVRGPCQQPGETVYTLDELLTVGPNGYATLTTQVPVPTVPLLDGRHTVRLNTPGQGAPEFVLACAALPQAPLNEAQRQVPGVQEIEPTPRNER